jgi:hypothetical protein
MLALACRLLGWTQTVSIVSFTPERERRSTCANKLPEMRCWVYDVHGGCAPPAQGGSNERAHTRSHPHTGCPRAHCSLILSADRADEGAAGSACRVAAGREDGPCSPVNLTWPAPAHSAAASDKTAEPVCVPTGCLLCKPCCCG